jgi:hypothetical protein
MSARAVCTVVAKNYLAHARTLMSSVRLHHPECLRVVLLVDRVEGCFEPAQEDFVLLLSEDLRIPNSRLFHFKYSLLELATAVKPWLLALVREACGVDELLFLDPDMLVLDRLDPAFEALGHHAIVLTPHLTAPIADAGVPGERDFLRVGIYNLGFLGLSGGTAATDFLDWWKQRLANDCIVDARSGLCLDQRWVDLVPGLFAGVHVLRDPSLNVAHWNLAQRSLEAPRLFHFSGFRPERPEALCYYPQDRFTMETNPARELYARYRQLLLENGYESCRGWPYAYGRWSDGSTVNDLCRRVVRDDPALQAELGGALESETEDRIRSYLNAPCPDAGPGWPLVTRLLGRIHRDRPDLQRAFPDLGRRDREAATRWFVETGAAEHGLAPALVEPVATSLAVALQG